MKLDALPFPIKAMICTIMPLGSIHLLISNIYALTTGDWDQANYFHILALDLVFPQLGHGMVSYWLSQLFWLIFLGWLYYFWRQGKKETTKE